MLPRSTPTLLFMVTLATLFAQDQSLVITGPLKVAPDVPATAKLSVNCAEVLIRDQFGADALPTAQGKKPQQAKNDCNYDPISLVTPKDAAPGTPTLNTYYMIHSVEYQDSGSAVQSQNWYVYHAGWENQKFSLIDPRRAKHYKELRLFGSADVALVYMHVVQAATEADVDTELQKLTTTDLNAMVDKDGKAVTDEQKQDKAASEKKRQANIMAFLNYFFEGKGTSPANIAVVGQHGEKLGPYQATSGWYVVNADLANELNGLNYRVDITKKTPAPLQNLQSIVGLALGGMGAATATVKVTLRKVVLVGGQAFDVEHLPSNIDVNADAKTLDTNGATKDNQLGKNTFDDEKKYWYDFSLGLPVSSYNDFRYDQTASSNGGYQITAKNINQKNLFAFVDAGVLRDTKALQYQIIPTFLYGIPIAGQPLKHHIFAGSFGCNLANFFVGVRLDEKKFYTDFSKPLIGSNVNQRWRTHLVYGVNFPVSLIVSTLKKPATK